MFCFISLEAISLKNEIKAEGKGTWGSLFCLFKQFWLRDNTLRTLVTQPPTLRVPWALLKAVLQHTYGGAGGRGGIAPSHSRHRHCMEVSGQRHAPAAHYPREKDPLVPNGQEAVWAPEPVWTQEVRGKIICLCRGSNIDSSSSP
jgi:hypothetical protein